MLRIGGINRNRVNIIQQLIRFNHSSSGCDDRDVWTKIVGTREYVGFGLNGNPMYVDLDSMPFPSIRYRECTPELMALREKERGDWRKLTIEEKKYLYRASFRQTFAEFNAPSTEWKSTIGNVLMGISVGLWLYWFVHHKVLPDAPSSFSPESRIAQYYRQVEINNQPMSGNYRPPGAELRIHPKNSAMLDSANAEATAH